MEEALTFILSVIISTVIIAIIIQHSYEVKIKKHELKLIKYIALGDELAKLAAKVPDNKSLMSHLNGALFFSSDEVVKEVLNFNEIFTKAEKDAKEAGQATIQIPSKDIKPLMIAIRNELDLKSNSIKEKELKFFQVP